MARLLAYTSPARGHLYPTVDTLRELHRRGHEIHVRTLSSEVPALRALGFEAQGLDPAIENTPLDTWRASTPQEGLALALATFGRRADIEIQDMRQAMEAVDPDAAIIDITTVGAAAVAEREGLPWSRSIPLFQHFLIEPAAPRAPMMVPFALHPDGVALVNRARQSVGLEPVEADGLWRADAEIYHTATPFEDDSLEFPGTFRLVGPGLWAPPAAMPSWFQDLTGPIVLVSVSSEFQRDDALIEVALEALANEPVQVVVSSAAHDPGRFAMPANARIAAWLPHDEAIRRASVVVCHGGMGITQKSLAAGVPVCVVPFGRDQFEVAARVMATGSGSVLAPDALDPRGLRQAVRAAMESGSGAGRVAAGFAQAGGASAAADAIEGTLAAGARRPTAAVG